MCAGGNHTLIMFYFQMCSSASIFFRRSNAAARCRLTAAFLPAIFHHVMRSLSVMVDLFLGIAPSLSGCLATFTGVPPSLYGPLVDVAEYFQYASVRSPDINFLSRLVGRTFV